MITGISIENFKGIRERARLEFRPITLLFGANSAGKSTILQALHYANEVFGRKNLNPDRTICGGSAVDLGGFQNLVHGHDRAKEIGISLTLNVTAADLEDLAFRDIADYQMAVDDFCRPFSEIEITFVVGWSEIRRAPFVMRYEIAIDGRFFAAISNEAGRPESVLKVDSRHPVFLNLRERPELTQLGHLHPICVHPLAPDELDSDETFLGALWEWFAHNGWIEGTIERGKDLFEVYLDQRHDAFPDPDSALCLRTITRPGGSEDATRYEGEVDVVWAVESVIKLLTWLIVGPAQVAKKCLAKLRYLGPVRETPPRNYAPPQYPDDSRWATGLGAWDALQGGSDELVGQVSEWLGDPNNLNAGCRVERRNYFELDLADPVVRKLIDRRAFDDLEQDEGIDLARASTISRIVIVPTASDIELRPHDVGVGISQVVPVIVTALDGRERLLAIEQPELHIHPRMQAEIADLFVEASQKNQHRFLIETHSEHLILRLLRRIRETEKGTVDAQRQLRTHDLAVYYVRMEDGCSTVSRIDVDVKGEFIQPWPDDFFEIDFFERFPDAR